MRNDPEFNIYFVQLLEKYPVLYDFTLDNYTNRSEVKKAWEELGRQLNETPSSCMEKWRILRGGFTRYLKTQAPGSDYNPKRPYYLSKYMKFLIPFVRTRKHIENSTISDDYYLNDGTCGRVPSLHEFDFLDVKDEKLSTFTSDDNHENNDKKINKISKNSSNQELNQQHYKIADNIHGGTDDDNDVNNNNSSDDNIDVDEDNDDDDVHITEDLMKRTKIENLSPIITLETDDENENKNDENDKQLELLHVMQEHTKLKKFPLKRKFSDFRQENSTKKHQNYSNNSYSFLVENEKRDEENNQQNNHVKMKKRSFYPIKETHSSSLDADNNADLNFFKSILPDVMKLKPKDKINLKISVLRSLNDLLYSKDTNKVQVAE